MKRMLFTIGVLIFFLSACGSPATAPLETKPSEPPAPTEAPPPPEPTKPPEPGPTPKLILFSDEFSGGLAPEWAWHNEDPERWSITEDSWLQITAGNPGFPAKENGKSNQVNQLQQPAPDGSFILTTRLIAAPDENFQQAGIFMIHDDSTYVAILNAFCQPCLPDSGGYGFFMEAGKAGEYISPGMWQGRDPETTDAYLRLVYSAENNTVTGFFSTLPDQWQQLGVIEDFPSIEFIGLGAANAPSQEGIQEDLVAYYTYAQISTADTPVLSDDPPPMAAEPPPPPEPTTIPEATPLPEGILFRDDFEGYLQPGWEWINENPEKWAFVDFGDSIWLQIVGDKPGGLAEQSNTLMRSLPEGDFVLTAHILADPRQNHHQANIFIFENETNYIRLNFGFCDHCGLPEGGYGYFMETIIDNNPFGDFYAIPRNPEDTDIYLRLVNQGGSITAFYATEYGDWQRIGAFGNFFDFVSVGLGATNSVPPEWEVEDIEAIFDYFEISQPE